MTRGWLDFMGAEVTGEEARQLYRVFRTLESRPDIESLTANLKKKYAALRENRALNAEIESRQQHLDQLREERAGQVGEKEKKLDERISRQQETLDKLIERRKPQLTDEDWLFITGLAKAERAVRERYKPQKQGVAGQRKMVQPTADEIAEETINELYQLAQLQGTQEGFTAKAQRQLAPRSAPTTPLMQQATSPTARELTMRSRRAPTDISRAEPGQAEVRTGAEVGRPAGLQAEREARLRRRTPAAEPTDYGSLVPQPLAALPKSVVRTGRVLDYTQQHRPSTRAQVESGGRVAEPTSYPATGRAEPENVRYAVRPERKAEITEQVGEVADKIANQPPNVLPQNAPKQENLPGISAIKRLSQRPDFWEKSWRTVARHVDAMLKNLATQMENIDETNINGIRSELNGIEGNLQTFIRDAGLQFEGGEPLWNTVMTDRFEQAANFLDQLEQVRAMQAKLPAPEGGTQMTLGAPRRQPGKTVGEKVSNVLTDF